MKTIWLTTIASTLMIACAPPAIDKLPNAAPAGINGIKYDGINFGIDFNQFAKDGECDDPRFEGADVTALLLAEDAYRDATDCMTAYKLGTIKLRQGASKA